MQNVLATLVVGPLSAAVGFYLAAFVYRLVIGILYYLGSMTVIILYLLGIVSSETPTAPFAPLILIQWARTSEVAFLVAGVAGAVGTLIVIARVIAAAPAASYWRRAAIAGAVMVGFGAVAGAGDLWYGITPYVDRLMPHSDLAAAEREVTCRLTVTQVAQLQDKLSGCIAEVEGVLVYEERMRRFSLYPLEDRHPTISVYFFRGRRSIFGDDDRTGPPRFYDQVSNFVGKRVRIVGTALNGQLSADVGHIVLAETPIQ
jgi:hypothetical protein